MKTEHSEQPVAEFPFTQLGIWEWFLAKRDVLAIDFPRPRESIVEGRYTIDPFPSLWDDEVVYFVGRRLDLAHQMLFPTLAPHSKRELLRIDHLTAVDAVRTWGLRFERVMAEAGHYKAIEVEATVTQTLDFAEWVDRAARNRKQRARDGWVTLGNRIESMYRSAARGANSANRVQRKPSTPLAVGHPTCLAIVTALRSLDLAAGKRGVHQLADVVNAIPREQRKSAKTISNTYLPILKAAGIVDSSNLGIWLVDTGR